MSEIVARSVVDGINIYVIKEGVTEYPLSENALYDVTVLEGLKESGYKIRGYYGNILMPDGTCIKDIIESTCSFTQDEIDLAIMLGDSSMTEQEASFYFDRDVEVKEVSLMESSSEIKTREELEAYLVSWEKKYKLGVVVDYRPLNSFVAREALYELSEINANLSNQKFFRIIALRRKFRTLDDFYGMIKFLQSQGVLQNEYTLNDVRVAYLSWGVCGVKTPIVGVEQKMFDTTSIYEMHESANSLRASVPGLMSRSGRVVYPGGEFDITEFENVKGFEGAPFKPAIPDSEYFSLKNGEWDYEYKFIPLGGSTSIARTYVKFLDKNGVIYRAKIDVDSMIITTGDSVLYHGEFLAVYGVDGEFTPLKRCLVRKDYEVWQVLKAKVRDLVRKRTKKPPVSSSFELFLNEGVSPEAATTWAGYLAEEAEGSGSDGIPYHTAGELYIEGPEPDCIRRYNPQGLEYTDLDELIEIFKSTRESMMNEGTYLNGNNLAVEKDRMYRPIECLEFAKAFKQGNCNVGDFAEGMAQDLVSDYDFLAEALDCYLKIKGLSEANEVKQALLSIEDNSVFDIEEVFPYRDNAYRGYLFDRARLNGERAKGCVNAVAVTRVYREGANVPIPEQRHYMFDCVMLDLSNRGKNAAGAWKNRMVYAQDVITERIVDTVKRSNENWVFKRCVSLEAPSIALSLMFSLLAGKAELVRQVMGNFVYALDIYGKKFEVMLPADVVGLASTESNYVVDSQCTLYDWCGMEISGVNWCMYCVNANITPWEVTPKGSVIIPSYNFRLNYSDEQTIAKLPEDYQREVREAHAKVSVISRTYNSMTLVPIEDLDYITYTEDNINSVLSMAATETPWEYNQRIQYGMSKRKSGMYLKRVPLKSDVVYGNWWDAFYAGTAPTEVEWAEDDTQIGLGFRTYQVVSLGSKNNEYKITSSENVFEPWHIKDQSYEDIMKWTDLIRGVFKPTAATIVTGNQICFITAKGQVMRNAKTVTLNDMIALVNKGIVYQLSARSFLLSTYGGNYYYLEVR